MTEYLEPLRVVAHRARLLAAGEMDAQVRQEFLRIAENLEAEALAEVPGELRPIGGEPRNLSTSDVTGEQEPSAKRRRGRKKAS